MKNRLLPISFLLSVFFFNGCEDPCALDREVRLKIDWRFLETYTDSYSYWQNFTHDSIRARMEAEIVSGLSIPGQILLSDSAPDYILRIERIDGGDEVNEQTLEDPCQEEHSALYNAVTGGPHSTTFTLHSCKINCVVILFDSRSNTGKRYTCTGYSSQQTEQPPSLDSVNCNSYQVTGVPNAHDASVHLGRQISSTTRCKLHDMME